MKKFNQLFDEHTGEGILKWSNYGDIYDKHFAPYRDQQINILEIGVLKGGSMRIWEKYFPKANIFGIDIVEECKQYESDRTKIFIVPKFDDGKPVGTVPIVFVKLSIFPFSEVI